MNEKLSILIVDDHPGFCVSLKDILEMDENKVNVVLSGKPAINICKKQRFDVIFMDICLPDLNGVGTYRRIKKYTKETWFFMLNAYSVTGLKEEALRESAIAFLPKPLDIEKTLNIIQQVKEPPVLIDNAFME